MAIFRHPHLVRGIVYTPHGAFTVVRGLVDLSDEVGDDLGWTRAESTQPVLTEPQRATARRMDRLDAN
jgi:hypothetical protein